MAPFPHHRVASANPRTRGRELGAAAREQIHGSVAVYEETFAYHTGLAWAEVAELALEFAEPIAAYDPAMLAEIEGIAAGAGLSTADVLALNARTEIMFGLKVPPLPECTAFCAGPGATADGRVLLGQNWDWRTRTSETVASFEVDQGPGGPAFLMVAEAGLIGKTGFNEHGVGVVVNALVSDRDVGERLVPTHAVLRGILNSATVEEALAAIVRARRGASAAYTIAGPDGAAVCAEVGPGGLETVRLIAPAGGLLFHTNHFLGDAGLGDLGREMWADSVARLARIELLLGGRRGELSAALVEEALRDREGYPDAICRFPNPADHPVLRGSTVASVVMDLSARTADVTAGPPSESEYERLRPTFAAVEAA
ncbi:MAG: C45 family peptidase [Solirubrobacterales bacterium]